MSHSVSFGVPKCPNHKVNLMLTGKPGIGQCPVSLCYFEYKAEENKREVKVDSYGRVLTEYTVKGDEK